MWFNTDCILKSKIKKTKQKQESDTLLQSRNMYHWTNWELLLSRDACPAVWHIKRSPSLSRVNLGVCHLMAPPHSTCLSWQYADSNCGLHHSHTNQSLVTEILIWSSRFHVSWRDHISRGSSPTASRAILVPHILASSLPHTLLLSLKLQVQPWIPL